MTKEKFTVVSLFSGAMGLDIGLHKTGRFRLLACVEREPIFCQTIRANVAAGNIDGSPKVYEIDITKLDPSQLLVDLGLKPGELDLLVGGPPCQSFSTAGRRGTVQDPRGTLIWEFLRFVRALQPKMFLMENVRGLLSAALVHRPIAERPDKGGSALADDEQPGSVVKLFADDLRKLSDSPYRVDCFEVNSVNYGAPQIRERVLFFGNRYNLEMNMPLPTHGGDRVNGYTNLLPWKTIRDVIGDLKPSQTDEVLDFSPRKKKYLQMIPPGGNWRHLPENEQVESMGKAFFAKGGRSGWWRRLTWDLPSPTLVTMPNHASTSLCHPEHVRALSLREYCRIQEFPDNWIVEGKTSQKYTQVGNAVPPKLGEIAGIVIVEHLEYSKMANLDFVEAQEKVSPYRIIYVQSHVRTRSWFKNGQAVLWDQDDEFNQARYSAPRTIRTEQLVKEKETEYGRKRTSKVS